MCFASTASSTSASARSCCDLEEAGAGRELDDPRLALPGRSASSPLEHRHQRRVAREDADLAGGARDDEADHLGVALVARRRRA